MYLNRGLGFGVFPLGPFHDAIVPAAVEMVQQRAQIQQVLKDNLLKAQ